MKATILLAILTISSSLFSVSFAADIVDQEDSNVKEIYDLMDHEVSTQLDIDHEDYVRFFVPTLVKGKTIKVLACIITTSKASDRFAVKHEFTKGETLLIKDMKFVGTSEGIKQTAKINLVLEVKEDTMNVECSSTSTSMDASIKRAKSYLNQVLSKN